MTHPGDRGFALGVPDAPRVLLFHGLTGAPSELWPLGWALARAGYRVEAPLWPGHGTSPRALVEVDVEAVLATAFGALRAGRRPAGIVGLSFGALVATCVAPEAEPGSLVLLAPAVRMAGGARLFDGLGLVPWSSRLPLLLRKATPEKLRAAVGSDGLDSYAREALLAPEGGGFDGRYDRIPLRWSTELRRVRRLARSAASRVKAPVLVAHGTADLTASVDSASEVSAWFSRAPVSVRLVRGGRHQLLLGERRGEVASLVGDFLDTQSGRICA